MTEQCEGTESFIANFEFTTKFAKLARRGVAFLRALLKDGNSQSRPQPEAVLSLVSYRWSRRRRQRKRLLLKVRNMYLAVNVAI